MKTKGYLILFYHLVLGYNYKTKLMSNVTNRWKHRHAPNSTGPIFCFRFCKKNSFWPFDSHFNYKSAEHKSNLKYWWENMWLRLRVVLDQNNQSQIQVDCALLADLSHTDHCNHQKQQAFTSVTVARSH